MAKVLNDFREWIKKAKNGDKASIENLRYAVERCGKVAPEPSLIKIAEFIADEIYPDADRMEIERN